MPSLSTIEIAGSETPVLELDELQSGILHPRPSPYAGAYLIIRIDDRRDGREMLRRLSASIASAADWSTESKAWLTVTLSYAGLKALGVPQASLDTFAPEFREGMAARAELLGDTGESAPANWEAPLGTPDVHVAIAVIAPDAAKLAALLDEAKASYADLAGIVAHLAPGLLRPADRARSLRLQGWHKPPGDRGERRSGFQPAGEADQGGRVHPRLPGRDRRHYRDNLGEMRATIWMRILCRGGGDDRGIDCRAQEVFGLIVAERQSGATFAGVAYDAGLPGPRFRSMASRRR